MNEPGSRRVEHVMGMPIVVDLRDEDVDPAILDLVFDWLRFVDATYSTYKDDSEIGRLNNGELDHEQLRPDVRAVLDYCEQLRIETGGYFDVRAVSRFRVDPSGLVKGWSVDAAARMLDAAGARNYAINAGGDIRTRGRPVPDERWRIGIQHPHDPTAVAAVVGANDAAVATSGAYERGEHVVDPHTGRPPYGLLSVTVTGPTLAAADAYATGAFAMGAERAPAWLAELRDGYEALAILVDGRVLSTRGFPASGLTTGSQARPDGGSAIPALIEACT